MDLLLKLAEDLKVSDGIQKMFSGCLINETEKRAVLHVALRNRSNEILTNHDPDITADVARVLAQMKSFTDSVQVGSWKGFTGKSITDVVNIGIGGSDLGGVMVCEALKPYWTGHIRPHFISNIDATHIFETLKCLNPETTLFTIVSKSFSTTETMTNAESAREWLIRGGASQRHVAKHFVAVSTNTDKVKAFGIDPENMFVFWDWVGGRFSVSSAVGLSIMCTIGYHQFIKFLDGMHAMDLHFRDTPFQKNAPVCLALLSIWYNNFFGVDSEVIIPYDQYLAYLPKYLQQAFMESNGKSVDRSGNPVDYNTGMIIWGETGTNSQHSFFQLLHQGTRWAPVNFLVTVRPRHPIGDHHKLLVANALAQAEALMIGRSHSEVIMEWEETGSIQDSLVLPFKVFEGNRPSTMIMMKELNPYTLGMLIALFEHKIFVQGLIWNIFSFDQWGVELGKKLADNIYQDMEKDPEVTGHDGSTSALLKYYQKWHYQE